jgi:hypothetical protein
MRMMSPTWEALADKGVSYAPGEYDSAIYNRGVTDKQFAAAVPDLRKVGIKKLHLQDTQLTDASIDGILQLRKLERLDINTADFTADGLVRLAGLPRLKLMYVPRGQFTEEELTRIREALPNARVEGDRLGSERFNKPDPQTQPASTPGPS